MTEAETTDRALAAMRAAVALLRNGHVSQALAVIEGAERDCRMDARLPGQGEGKGGVSGEGR